LKINAPSVILAGRIIMQQTTDNGQPTTNNRRMNLVRRLWPLFFLAAIAFYFYGLGAMPFVGPDEPRYAQVAREMFTRADPVTPTLGGRTWFEKPALLYWMAAASYAAFGVSEWAARFVPACAGLLSILMMYWLGRRVERASENEDDESAADSSAADSSATDSSPADSYDAARKNDRPLSLGLWCAVALASSLGMMIFSRALSFDVIVTMTMTIALACFFVSELERDEKKRRLLLAAFYAGVGASLLAKGLIGIVIPGGVIFAYFLLRRGWPEKRLWASLLWGLPLALAVAAIWYGPVIQRHGWKFVDEFFIQHHFARYVSNKYRHPGPFYYYIPTLLWLTIPWPAFLVSAIVKARRWNWRGADALSRFRLFALAWLICPVAFFSISGSKLPGYILPALPAAALLIGEQLSRFTRNTTKTILIRLTGLLLLALVLAGLIYAHRSGYVSMSYAWLVVAPLIVAAMLTLALSHLRRLCLMATAGAMFLSLALAVNCFAALIGRRESARELLQQAAERGFASAPVCGMYVIERTSEFYAGERVMRDDKGEFVRFEGAMQVLEAAQRHGGAILVFVPVEAVPQLTEYSRITTEIIGHNNHAALVAVESK
jgi:4-amino-4-deoxy-L-arabinose transferase-like glycosyltransferase